jgi:hypothetical protein
MAFFQEKKKPTAQVHVTFFCPFNAAPVTESKLREMFERFGNVLDVTINRADFHMDTMVHSGFGFIHYELQPLGVRSALAAIENMHERVVDGISLGCTVSHGLENYLKNSNSNSSFGGQPAMQLQQQQQAHLRPRPVQIPVDMYEPNNSGFTPSPRSLGSSSSSSFPSSPPGFPVSSSLTPRSLAKTNGFNRSGSFTQYSLPPTPLGSSTIPVAHDPAATTTPLVQSSGFLGKTYSQDEFSTYSAPVYSSSSSAVGNPFPSSLSHQLGNNQYPTNNSNPFPFPNRSLYRF